MGKWRMVNAFYVEIIPHQGTVRRMALSGDSLIVGRSPRHAGLLLDDPRVSRLHVRIQRDPDTGITVTDLFSANGSTLDGRPLPSGIPFHWLIDQVVLIGETRLILKYGDVEGL